MDYFNLLVMKKFYQLIIAEKPISMLMKSFCRKRVTAEHVLANGNPLTTSELKIFLGLTIHMGTIPLPRIPDYWKIDRLFGFQMLF